MNNTDINYYRFMLKSKQKELSKIKVDTFTYNPQITSLMVEIKELKEKISEMEKSEEN